MSKIHPFERYALPQSYKQAVAVHLSICNYYIRPFFQDVRYGLRDLMFVVEVQEGFE